MTKWLSGDDPEWAAQFTSYTESAYRLEGQQQYCSPGQDAAVARFLAGQPADIELGRSLERIRTQAARGLSRTKVRVVVEPPTPYTRWQLTQYPRYIEAGEDVLVLAVPMGDWPAGLPHHDYWFFDDQYLWRMHYHENFYWKGAELIEDPAEIEEARRARDLAVSLAVPYADYLKSKEAASD